MDPRLKLRGPVSGALYKPHSEDTLHAEFTRDTPWSCAIVPHMVDRPKMQVDQAHVNEWKVAATTVRFARAVLDRLRDPKPGSLIERADSSLREQREYVSDSVLSAVGASIDNLSLWANTVMPLVFIEEHPVENPPRPYFTLARAGLESAAQAAWILAPATADEMIDRHLRLALDSLQEWGKSLRVLNPDQQRLIHERITRIRSSHWGVIKAAPSYCDMVRAVAPSVDHDPDVAEMLWRTASAAAHGKQWFMSATHTGLIGEEFEPERFRAEYLPHPEKITALVTLASQAAERTLMRYAELAGADLGALTAYGIEVVRAQQPRAVLIADRLNPRPT